MKNSKFLKEQRAEKVKAQELLMTAIESRAEKVFTEDEEKRFNDLDSEIKALDADIRTAENIETAQKRAAAAQGKQLGTPEGNKPEQRYSLHKAIRSGVANLSGAELAAHNAIQERAAKAGIQTSGILIPMASVRAEKRANAQTVGEDGGQYGGALVATDHRGVIDMLNPKPIVAKLGATYLRGLTGNVEFGVNEGGITATWEGEVAEVTATKNKYTKKTMKPKRLTATVEISKKNLAQSATDLEAYTMSEILGAVERAIDAAAFNGSGVGEVPKGIANDADVNVIAIGANGGPLTWAEIVAMETKAEVANASTSSAKYAFNAQTKGKLKVTKHQAGDANYLMTSSNEVNGYPVEISNLLPADLTKGSGTDLSMAIFGDWKELLVAEWSFLDITVDDITLAASGQIKLTVNMYMDVLVRQPKAFTVIKDIDNA